MDTRQIRIKEIKRDNQRQNLKEIHPTPSPIRVLIKNQNKNNHILNDTIKKLIKGRIINKTETSIVKLNVLPINSI